MSERFERFETFVQKQSFLKVVVVGLPTMIAVALATSKLIQLFF